VCTNNEVDSYQCDCVSGWEGDNCQSCNTAEGSGCVAFTHMDNEGAQDTSTVDASQCTSCATSCNSILLQDSTSASGVYLLCGPPVYEAFCDMETNGVSQLTFTASTVETAHSCLPNCALLNCVDKLIIILVSWV
jgi:hypothetical protein